MIPNPDLALLSLIRDYNNTLKRMRETIVNVENHIPPHIIQYIASSDIASSAFVESMLSPEAANRYRMYKQIKTKEQELIVKIEEARNSLRNPRRRY